MTSKDEGKLIPQIEEGITKVTFKNRVASQSALENSYRHIMVAERPIGMAVGCAFLKTFDAIAEMLGVEIGPQHRKAVGHVQTVGTLRVFAHNLD